MEIDFTSAVGYLFYYNLIYFDLNITRRIIKNYYIKYLTVITRFVKRIRLE
jgi:hypothetical protein